RSTGAQPRQARLEVLTDRIELFGRQESALECGVAEAAEQRAPVIVRAERMIGDRIAVVLPAVGQFLLESRLGLVRPGPMTQQAGETVDGRVGQRLHWRGALALEDGLIDPILEADRAEPRALGGNQRALVELGSEVSRVRVDDHLARIVARAETLTDQLIE